MLLSITVLDIWIITTYEHNTRITFFNPFSDTNIENDYNLCVFNKKYTYNFYSIQELYVTFIF